MDSDVRAEKLEIGSLAEANSGILLVSVGGVSPAFISTKQGDIMIRSYFEDYLAKTRRDNSGAEAMWDDRAEMFSKAQLAERSGFPTKVTRFLLEQGALEGAIVLDIGGGSGRYAIPFAEYAARVRLTDFSANMLEQARRNALAAHRENIDYEKLDWMGLKVEGSPYEKAFDLAFAAMCPAVRSPEGIRKMTQVARKACAINQFVRTSDSLTRHLRSTVIRTQADGPSYDPHNDRGAIQAYFNLVVEMGYDPQVVHHRFQETIDYTLEEATTRFAGSFGGARFQVGGAVCDLREAIRSQMDGDRLRIEHDTVLATIYWNL